MLDQNDTVRFVEGNIHESSRGEREAPFLLRESSTHERVYREARVNRSVTEEDVLS